MVQAITIKLFERGIKGVSWQKLFATELGERLFLYRFLADDLLALIPGLDRVDNFIGFIKDAQHLILVFRDEASRQDHVFHPVEKAAPEIAGKKYHRERLYLLGLDQREDLGQLVHRAQAAGHDDKSGGVFHQHDLAYEEMMERYRAFGVDIAGLLHRQVDVQADGLYLRPAGAFVGGLHYPGPA